MKKYILLISLGTLLSGAVLYPMNNETQKENTQKEQQNTKLSGQKRTSGPIDEETKMKYHEQRDAMDANMQALWNTFDTLVPQLQLLTPNMREKQEITQFLADCQLSLVKTRVALMKLDEKIDGKK